ncbi:MAG: hypothetical protein KGJ13_08305 [Patescibacteria group bacterium]|nr:hypothetical protein [Patescibacteria group bacterium]
MDENNEVFEGDLVIIEEDVICSYKKIAGSVDVRGSAKLAAPKLESVGGSVVVWGSAKLAAPKLESVGGSVDVRGSAKLAAPRNVRHNDEKAKKIGTEITSTVAKKCQSVLLASFAASGFSFADGVLARIVSQRGPVSRVIICGRTEVSYLVTDGEAYSHGKTLKEARDGLLYKIGNRDTSEFKAWTLDKEVSKRDAIRAYRTITGACEGGVRAWMEARKTPETIKVSGIIDLTKGAYGAEKFADFFKESFAVEK